MNYAMEHIEEANRLEEQAKQESYDLKKEFRFLQIKPNQLVLDAGCGTGLVSRYLTSLGAQMEACDQSEIRLQQAKNLTSLHGQLINFFQSNLESQIKAPDNKYDGVVCRFVIEHLLSPQAAVNELYRVTKPQGEVYIVDLDGILFNLYTTNATLNKYLTQLKKEFKLDLFVGRKLPSMLGKAGFTNIKWDIDMMNFQGEELKREKENYRERFKFAFAAFAAILGEKNTHHFVQLYLEELDNPTNTLFYNKFIARGTK